MVRASESTRSSNGEISYGDSNRLIYGPPSSTCDLVEYLLWRIKVQLKSKCLGDDASNTLKTDLRELSLIVFGDEPNNLNDLNTMLEEKVSPFFPDRSIKALSQGISINELTNKE